MKIKAIHTLQGKTTVAAGTIIDVDDASGARLIASGAAKQVSETVTGDAAVAPKTKAKK